MSCSWEVVTAGPQPIVVRRAVGPGDAHHLRATGERLAAAAHPGVVEVVSSSGTAEEWELQLVHAGRPVELIGHLSPEQVAGVAAAVAATLADLHAVGTVHGNIDGSHVLIGAFGRPVLCGFGPPTAAERARPEDDVAALGALIVALLGTELDLEPIPDRRWRRRGGWTGWARRSLLLVADQACAEPPTRRPSARRLAAAIADAVPGAVAANSVAIDVADPAAVPSVDPLDALRPDPAGEPPTHRLPALVCAVAGVVALGIGALRLARPVDISGSVASSPIPPVTAVDPQPTTVPPTNVQLTTTTRVTLGPVSIDGTTVFVGGQHYEIGQPGDLVVLGDWDGDHVPTAAVLRPPTGEVFVFSSWTTGEDVVVHPITTVRGAVELLVTVAGDRDQLVARRSDGSRQPVPTASST